MGLTGGVQARTSATGRAACFAGPTGVGKTELAKTLTQLVFGDDRAYIRFDMSEFAEEHTGRAAARRAAGYIGYDAAASSPTRCARSRSPSCCSTRSRRRTRASSTSSCRSWRTVASDGRSETAYLRGDPRVHDQPRHLSVDDEHGPPCRKCRRTTARRGGGAGAQRRSGLLQVPAVAAGDPEPHRRQHHRVRFITPGDRRRRSSTACCATG